MDPPCIYFAIVLLSVILWCNRTLLMNIFSVEDQSLSYSKIMYSLVSQFILKKMKNAFKIK